jgi:hypothetical protein
MSSAKSTARGASPCTALTRGTVAGEQALVNLGSVGEDGADAESRSRRLTSMLDEPTMMLSIPWVSK